MSIWPSVPLTRIAKPIERAEVPVTGNSYRQVGVKLWGVGAYERETIDGGGTQYKTLSRVEVDDIIVNKIWARNGSVAVVPTNLAGCYVSGEFPTFTPISDKLDPRWFHWITKTRFFWDQCDAKSRGTSGKKRIRPERFLEIEIPLPPLPEQRRIVARIEELAAKINEARELRQKAAEEVEALVSRAASTLIDNAKWSSRPLGDLLVESPRNGLSPKREVENGGRPMLRINAVSSSPTRFVDLTALKMVEVQDDDAAPFELRCDDVFIVRYNGDINRVAKAAIYKGTEPSRSIFPDKLMRLRTDHSKITPDFLVYALGARSVRQQIEQFGKTTAGNIGISGGNAKSFQVPVPPIQDQHRILAQLDAIQSQVDALKKLQAETAVALVALLPSILDKAFKGEL